MDEILCLDANLSGLKNAIANYVIPYSKGIILVDPGPGSTLEHLRSSLANHHLNIEDVSHVLLTHIHLDHAGAAGWFARRGGRVYVHPVGAPHMSNPERLLASARRIYGDRMESTWGEFLPVSPAKLVEVEDGEEISIDEIRISALHTPGHADHHVSYLYRETCFCGDIGGVRKPGRLYLRLPFVPPETNLGKWRESLKKIQATGCKSVALTHFGIYKDAQAHLVLAMRFLDEIESWLEQVMPDIPDAGTLQGRYIAFLHNRGRSMDIDEATLTDYDNSSPAQMDASGLFRYWHKIRMGE
jgi:glyoxylase-like metal-dependent hydrolase (beta-lactamase superfamily II)